MANTNQALTGAQTILATGGAGFIGSHTCVELLESGYRVIIVDDLSNSSEVAIDRIRSIVGDEASARLTFYQANIADEEAMNAIFADNDIDAVIHFAGFKAVGESVQKPIEYYENNIGGTLSLLKAMRAYDCKSIIFSSSATVYGGNNPVPYKEDMPLGSPTNPYGWTKLFIERILTDVCTSDPSWNVVLLRYFNPIGAHPSGLIGEDPKDIPNNLMPYITRVAVGKYPELHVFGDTYDTPDGTPLRDYIHVVDLAKGHVAALDWMQGRTGVETFNLGTGQGTSVLEIVAAFSKAYGKQLPYVIDGPRDGDLAECWADASKAWEVMGWKTELGIDDMCRDSWNWQSKNPDGYATEA